MPGILTFMEAILSSKGQVTIPLAVRKKLNLHKGSAIIFTIKGETATVTAKPKFSDYYGKFDGLAGGKDPAVEIAMWRSRGGK